MSFLRYICSNFMRYFIQINFLVRVRARWRSRSTFLPRKRNKRPLNAKCVSSLPFPLSLFLFFEAVTVHRGKLSPFFLRHPLSSVHFWVTILITNHDITIKLPDVPYVKPHWVLPFSLSVQPIGWKMEDLMKQIIWNWQLDIKEG